jgi:hypothetical protein
MHDVAACSGNFGIEAGKDTYLHLEIVMDKKRILGHSRKTR